MSRRRPARLWSSTPTVYRHSDLSNMMGRTTMALPMVAGHECAGVVEAIGEGVTRVKVGDHVVQGGRSP